nr:GntR family transcriptional regulator [Ornithinimicrobium sp. HY1745]
MLPIHEQISEALRTRIRSGDLPVGSRLPTETALMSQFGVARGTVRRALRTLNEQGIVQTLQGKGTYVRSGRPEPSIAQTLVGLSESLSYSEKSLTTTVLQQQIIPASGISRFPTPLEPAEQLLSLDRIRFLDGVPVARLKNWVRLQLAPGIDRTDFATTALFTALDSAATGQVSSGRRTFEAVLPGGDIAQSLGISTTTPLLFLTQVTYLDDGTVIEWSDVWMDSHHVTVAMNLTR